MSQEEQKAELHRRNRHRGRYPFAALIRTEPALGAYVRTNPAGQPTIDFADPAAVYRLNRAILRHDYGMVEWELPPGYLCPPIPGRADYVHALADLLGNGPGASVPRGPSVVILDIGVGANCIYPIIGVAEYGWHFVGTEIDPVAVASARRIVTANPALAGRVEIRRQAAADAIFAGIVREGERFAACLCNPPFHASAAAAAAGTARKLRNLGHAGGNDAPARNFGGRHHELWCRGGEVAFVRRMIAESAERPRLCRWFTSLVSQRESLPAIERALAAARVAEVQTIPLAHGQKRSRVLAWRFSSADT